MLALADLMEDHADELAELESLDNGKPVGLAKVVDVRLAVEHLRYFAGWPTKIVGQTLPVSQPGMHVYTRREPVGVCGQIIPWNFPLLMAAWKVAPALAAGCTVVLKPAEQTPLTALRMGELALEAGIPEGVLNVVTGDGETGAALVDHPGVDKIAFTGSTAVGREIGAKAGQRAQARDAGAGRQVAQHHPARRRPRGRHQGQLPGDLLQHRPGLQRRLAAVRPRRTSSTRWSRPWPRRPGKAKVGPGLAEGTQLGPLVSAEQHERVRVLHREGQVGGRRAGDGRRRRQAATRRRRLVFVEPTLFTATSDDLTIAREEIFGPVLVALPYEDLDEVAGARTTPSTAWRPACGPGTWPRRTALAAKLRAGSVYVNVWGPSDAAAPFGGFKASGIGREHGTAGLDAYLEDKTVWVSLS